MVSPRTCETLLVTPPHGFSALGVWAAEDAVQFLDHLVWVTITRHSQACLGKVRPDRESDLEILRNRGESDNRNPVGAIYI